MSPRRPSLSLRMLLAALLAAALGVAAQAQTEDGTALRARYDAIRTSLDASPFQRPLVLQSEQRDDLLRGDVYARVDQPFATARPNLQGTARWCDILILHLNVKACHATPAGLALTVGRKFEQAESDGYRLEFAYRVVASSADYLQVQLDAPDGPLGTSDYRIVLEAVPIDAKSLFLHMSYAYRYGVAARLAMRGYLATLGHDKVGFTVTGKAADGSPSYVDGVRGVLERNTMRYYLAIDAYLASTGLPPAQQLEKRLADWYDGNERYARQLHEMERGEYLTMKRKEAQAVSAGS